MRNVLVGYDLLVRRVARLFRALNVLEVLVLAPVSLSDFTSNLVDYLGSGV